MALKAPRTRRARPHPLATVGAVLLAASCSTVATAASCNDEASCQAHLADLVQRLDSTREAMRSKHMTLRALEELRQGILSGKRIELPSAEREHLQQGYPLVSEISVDSRHKPVSTNVSRHLTRLRAVGDVDVKFHQFLPLKKAPSGGSKAGSAALIVIIDTKNRLSLYTIEGELVLDKMELGHDDGRQIQLMTMSPTQDNHFIVTADDGGEIRHHALKIATRPQPKKGAKGSNGTASEGAAGEDAGTDMKKQPSLIITPNFTASLNTGFAQLSEPRKLTSLIAVDRGTQSYYVTGDTAGGISVFYRNGTLKGRVRVTEDFGGVKGMLRGQGQTLLFYSSHSFGFFSVSQIDVQSPLCSGWNSPLFDVAVDPSLAYNKVMLGLSDGDVLVFATTRGKSKVCDLTVKFPRVSPLPFKLHVFKGHVMGLPVIPEDMESSMTDFLRELYFFNMAAMEAGYGVSPTKAITVQASFKPKQPESYALLGTGSSSSDRAKSHVAIRFEGRPGVELFELSLKQPPAPKSAGGNGGDVGGGLLGGGGGGGGDDTLGSWLNWFPKIGVFGLALVGVVIWNVRKVTAQRKTDSLDDFDDSYFKEKLKERRERARAKDSDAGGLGDAAEKDEDD